MENDKHDKDLKFNVGGIHGCGEPGVEVGVAGCDDERKASGAICED